MDDFINIARDNIKSRYTQTQSNQPTNSEGIVHVCHGFIQNGHRESGAECK